MSNESLAITAQQEEEAQALSRWDALAADIAIATDESESKKFDYYDKFGNKQARSWIASLRRLKGKIERARKDAKAVHIERGRQVDQAAKLLESAVQGLIDPHEAEIKAIEAREQARVDAHKSVLDRISALTENIETASEAQNRLVELTSIDTDCLEEFSVAGANRKAEAGERLKAIWDSLVIQESERAELEALRAEKARLEKERERESIRQEVIEEERFLSHATAQPQPQPQPQPPAPAGESLQFQRLKPKTREEALANDLVLKMAGKTLRQIAAAIVGGTLHPAISVDISKLEEADEEEVQW